MDKFYKILRIIFMFLVIISIVSKCLAVNVTVDNTVDVNVTNIVYGDDLYNEIITDQENRQNQFVFTCLFPYLGNTESWTETLKPIFDDMHSGNYSTYVGMNQGYTNGVVSSCTYYVIHYYTNATVNTTMSYKSRVTQETLTIYGSGLNYPNISRYNVTYYPDNNTFSCTIPTTNTTIPNVVVGYRSQLMYDFINTIYGNNYYGLLNVISSYLDSINDIDSDILSNLVTISNSLNTISSNTSTNYSQQIGQINSKMQDLLSDNDTIISQNADMIAQQEEINDNIEETNEKLDEIKDTITNDTVESGASDLPSTNVNDIAQGGIDNIFQSIYNAFCTGQAQDIVFPIPFTGKNITLSPYYIRDMLNNNGVSWVYTLIQAFWGYLIGRFIVSDVSKKINKIKSGNIENVENENIKEEML